MSNHSTKYSLQVRNLSGIDQSAVVYQQHPNMVRMKAFPTAWLAQKIPGDSRVLNEFTWEVKYGLSWSDKVSLKNGVVYHSSISPPYNVSIAADGTTNAMKIHYDGLFRSEPINDDSLAKGQLRIKTDSSYTIPEAKEKNLSIAVHMDGKPVMALEGLPNKNYDFTVSPKYYIGTYDHVSGEVVSADIWSDLKQISFVGATTACCIIDTRQVFECNTVASGDCSNFFENQGFDGDL